METTKTSYLAENADNMDDDNAAAVEQIPAEMFAAVVAASLTGGEPGIDCDVAVTHETLADFDDARKNSWNEKGGREVAQVNGQTVHYYKNVQVLRGQRRTDLTVIDCGEIRVVLS